MGFRRRGSLLRCHPPEVSLFLLEGLLLFVLLWLYARGERREGQVTAAFLIGYGSFRFIADYDKIDENCCFVGNVLDGPTGNAIRGLGGRVNSGGINTYNEYYNFASTNQIENFGFSLQGDLDFDALKLTSISAYRESHALTNADSDFTSADLIPAWRR